MHSHGCVALTILVGGTLSPGLKLAPGSPGPKPLPGPGIPFPLNSRKVCVQDARKLSNSYQPLDTVQGHPVAQAGGRGQGRRLRATNLKGFPVSGLPLSREPWLSMCESPRNLPSTLASARPGDSGLPQRHSCCHHLAASGRAQGQEWTRAAFGRLRGSCLHSKGRLQMLLMRETQQYQASRRVPY